MAHLAAVRSRLDTSTVAEVARPSAMSWPTVASMAALGASRLGWLISSPKQLKLPARGAAKSHLCNQLVVASALASERHQADQRVL